MLAANAAKPRRERLRLTRIYEALRGLGYEGGYDAVRRYARRWQRQQGGATAEAYVPLSFAPGEAYQFDWRRPARGGAHHHGRKRRQHEACLRSGRHPP
jgi:hypothetical protein